MKRPRLVCLMASVCSVAVLLSGCMRIDPIIPQALFTVTASRDVVPFTATFDASLTVNPNGESMSYLWNFGDGGSGEGPVVQHQYQSSGVYDVKLTVVDAHGRISSVVLQVHALNPLPNPVITYAPRSIDPNEDGPIVGASEWVTFDASESSDDGEIVSYHWYFGDGNEAEGMIVKHRWHVPGDYNVVLSVTDNAGDTSTSVQLVRVRGEQGGCYPWVSEDDPSGGCQ